MTPDDGGDISSGEVHRSLNVLREDVRVGFAEVRTQISGLSVVSRERYESDRESDRLRFEDIESDVKENRSHNVWMLRTLVGALLVQLLGFAYVVVQFQGVPL